MASGRSGKTCKTCPPIGIRPFVWKLELSADCASPESYRCEVLLRRTAKSMVRRLYHQYLHIRLAAYCQHINVHMQGTTDIVLTDLQVPLQVKK